MIPIKIQCVCGQKYAFEVAAVNGRMPRQVNCPSCGADGTDAANEIIAQTLAERRRRPPCFSGNRPAAPGDSPIPANLPKAPVKKSKAAVWVGAVAGGVALVAAVTGFFGWKHHSPNNQGADRAATASMTSSPSTTPSAPKPKTPPAPASKTPPADRLKELKALFDQGLIPKEIYDQKRQEILDSL